MKEKQAKPFLKWAGGKTQLLPEINKRIPKEFETYFEPFIGAGAVFFSLQPQKAVLCDSNQELINTFETIRDNVQELIADLKTHQNNSEYFYKIRAMDREADFQELSKVKRASRIIFLNKTCFNGLYRVNKKGFFNTPFGNYTNPLICDEANLLACSKALQGVRLLCGSYDQIKELVGANDFVYMDPPYAPMSETANFTDYTMAGFGEEEQKQLKSFCDELSKKGTKFLMSNSSAPFIKELYCEYQQEEVLAKRAINSNAKGRGKITELLISPKE